MAAECWWALGQAPVHPHEPGPRSRSVMLEVPVGQHPGRLAPGLAARPQQQLDRVLMADAKPLSTPDSAWGVGCKACAWASEHTAAERDLCQSPYVTFTLTGGGGG